MTVAALYLLIVMFYTTIDEMRPAAIIRVDRTHGGERQQRIKGQADEKAEVQLVVAPPQELITDRRSGA